MSEVNKNSIVMSDILSPFNSLYERVLSHQTSGLKDIYYCLRVLFLRWGTTCLLGVWSCTPRTLIRSRHFLTLKWERGRGFPSKSVLLMLMPLNFLETNDEKNDTKIKHHFQKIFFLMSSLKNVNVRSLKTLDKELLSKTLQSLMIVFIFLILFPDGHSYFCPESSFIL